jgi:AcrR family transcriptional regulator
VIRRDGPQRASVRNVARESGLSMASLRHYFATQAERLLQELVPLDEERRAEAEVWLAFTGHALVDPEQRAIHQRIHDELNGCPPHRSRR